MTPVSGNTGLISSQQGDASLSEAGGDIQAQLLFVDVRAGFHFGLTALRKGVFTV
jgi:hypothetical protein